LLGVAEETLEGLKDKPARREVVTPTASCWKRRSEGFKGGSQLNERL
jgi:hypothetical protein